MADTLTVAADNAKLMHDLFKTKRTLEVLEGKLKDSNDRVALLEDKLKMAAKGLVTTPNQIGSPRKPRRGSYNDRVSPLKQLPFHPEEDDDVDPILDQIIQPGALSERSLKRSMEVVVFGSINMDMIAEVPHRPEPNTTLGALKLDSMAGGKGANEAVAAARLGAAVKMIGRVKGDLFGIQLRSGLDQEGINVDGVIVDTDPKAKGTGVAMVIVAKDKRGGKHTISCKGANEECGTPEVLIAEDYMQRGKQIGVVLMQNEVAHDAIVRVAKLSYNAEKLVIYKSSPIRKATDVSPLLYSYLDVLVVNEWEAPILLGWDEHQKDRFPLKSFRHAYLAARQLQAEKHVGVIVVNLPFGNLCRVDGGKTVTWLEEAKQPSWSAASPTVFEGGEHGEFSAGSSAESSRSTSRAPTPEIPNFDIKGHMNKRQAPLHEDTADVFIVPAMITAKVDFVGAADAATGAIAAALAEKMPMRYAMVWAQISGALSQATKGAQDSLPVRHELQEFLRKRKIFVDPYMNNSDAQNHRWSPVRPPLLSQFGLLFDVVVLGEIDTLLHLLEGIFNEESIDCTRFYRECVDFGGLTLLHIAVVFGDVEAVCLLLTWGAWDCVNTPDLYGATPIDRAFDMHNEMRDPHRKSDYKEIIWLLWSTRQVRNILLKIQVAKDTKAPLSPSKGTGSGSVGAGDGGSLNSDTPSSGGGDGGGGGGGGVGSGGSGEQIGTYTEEYLLKELEKDMPHLVDAAKENNVLVMIMHLLVGDMPEEKLVQQPASVALPTRAYGMHLLELICNEVNVELPTGCSKRYYWLRGDLEASIRRARMFDQVSLFHAAAFVGSGTMLLTLKELGVWDEEEFSHNCSRGRSPLHYAALSGDTHTCRLLLKWGFELTQQDKLNNTPLIYAPSIEFRDELLRLGKYRDVFISYGHNEEVSPFAFKLNADLNERNITTWIDTDIDSGERWREAIQDAIMYSGAVIVILSKKWVNSTYCTGEANVALALHKPIYVVLPPVSEAESAAFDDIPSALVKSMSERQFFSKFKTDKDYLGALDEFVPTCMHIKNSWSRRVSQKSSVSTMSEGKPMLYLPAGCGIAASEEPVIEPDFVFVACGGDVFTGHFAETLKDALVQENYTVRAGFKGHQFEHIRRAILACQVFILVLDEGDDQQFITRMLQEAGEEQKPILVCPYNISKESEGGMHYAASTVAQLRTACFSDWFGTGFGTVQNSLFQQLFENFVDQLNVLIPKKPKEAKSRQRSSSHSFTGDDPEPNPSPSPTLEHKRSAGTPTSSPFTRSSSDLASIAALSLEAPLGGHLFTRSSSDLASVAALSSEAPLDGDVLQKRLASSHAGNF